MMKNPASCLDDSLRYFPPVFPFKNWYGWVESSQLVSVHKSTFSPDCRLLWLKHLSFHWHLPLELLASGCRTQLSDWTGLNWVVRSWTWVQQHIQTPASLTRYAGLTSLEESSTLVPVLFLMLLLFFTKSWIYLALKPHGLWEESRGHRKELSS